MIVRVTVTDAGALIESKEIKMAVPASRILMARMHGQREAEFLAELKHGSLEIGDEVRRKP